MRSPCMSIVLAALVVVAAQRPGMAAPPTAAPARAADTATAQRRAAILSVYFHSHYSSSDWLPAEVRPMDLTEAARVLKSASGRLAESRRRRAIAHLVVAGLEDPDRCEAVRILGAPIGPLVETLRGLAVADGAATALLATPVAANPCQSGPTALAVPTQQALAEVFARLEQLLGPAIPDCAYEFHPAKTAFDLQTGITTAEVDTAVKRDAGAVCQVMDPQNWDADSCSDFFTAVYVAKKTGKDYVVGKDFSVAEDSNPPPPCTTYHRELFEHFDVYFEYPIPPGGLVLAWYKNLLGIDSKALAAGAHRYEYKLFRSLGSSVYFDVRPGGLGYDDGTITLGPRAADPSWTELHLTKIVQFTGRPLLDWALNLWASISLEAMAEELPEMACCQP